MPSEQLSKDDAADVPVIDLKNPMLAALLAWLVPGLGHIYQGRKAKGLLYMVSILGTFFLGLFLGGNSTVGWGRVVFYSSQPTRLAYYCQVGTGLVALPALFQANRAKNGMTSKEAETKSPLGLFMWPPRSKAQAGIEASDELDELHFSLNRFFELGTVYTMIAGLLNILAIFDAYGGPVPIVDEKKKPKADAKGDASTKDPPNEPVGASPTAATASTPEPVPLGEKG